MNSTRLTQWASAIALCLGCALPATAATIVYQNDFNSPVGWTDLSGNSTGLDYSQVNTLYGAQFQQTFTVETIRIAGNSSYSDPSGTGGAYALGMLAAVQNDLLSLTFDVAALSFVNVQMDFALMGPAACPVCGGPFSVAGQTPVFDLRLYDTPSGSFNIGAPGTLLTSGVLEGVPGASITELSWNNRNAALSTAGNTNGNVTLVLDLRSGPGLAGYAAFDNIVIASSDRPNDVTPIPEPSTIALMALGLAGLTGHARRRARGVV